MRLGYSMQDWFLRIAFAPSISGEGDGRPVAETHDSALMGSDFDVVVNSKWLQTATPDVMRQVLTHECAHAIEQFIAKRYFRK